MIDDFEDEYIAPMRAPGSGEGMPLDDLADALGMTLVSLCGRMGRMIPDPSEKRTHGLPWGYREQATYK
jgi:hypothetical protein